MRAAQCTQYCCADSSVLPATAAYCNFLQLAAQQIPRPHLDLSTKEVLVMEYFQGKKLYDAIKEYAEVHAAAQGKTFKDLGMCCIMY
jgi:ABC1 atypical kinase-like domain